MRGCFLPPSSSLDSQSSQMTPKTEDCSYTTREIKLFWPRMPTSPLFFLASSSSSVLLIVLVYSASLNFRSRSSVRPYLHTYIFIYLYLYAALNFVWFYLLQLQCRAPGRGGQQGIAAHEPPPPGWPGNRQQQGSRQREGAQRSPVTILPLG